MKKGNDGYKKGIYENWQANLSLVFLIVIFIVGTIAVVDSLGILLAVPFLAMICFAVLFYVLIPRKQMFETEIDDMNLMKKIGKMEGMSSLQRIKFMHIKRGEPFDYYKWRDDELRHRHYEPYGDFHLSEAPDGYSENYGLSESDKKDLNDYYDWWDGQLAELHKKEQSVN